MQTSRGRIQHKIGDFSGNKKKNSFVSPGTSPSLTVKVAVWQYWTAAYEGAASGKRLF